MTKGCMRNHCCPICGQAAVKFIDLQFGTKLQIPTDIDLRHCEQDNFLFVAAGSQPAYDRYYGSQANDAVHHELAAGSIRSPISVLQKQYLVSALGDLLTTPRRVLDFGCGEGSLLVELAAAYPSSSFVGFEPGPAAAKALWKARQLKLTNLSLVNLEEACTQAPYDLVIVSHVLEHVIDLNILSLLNQLIGSSGLLYLEVPDALQYENYSRSQFLYYFDRLHVNHFTPQALSQLAAMFGLVPMTHFSYHFPYRDQGRYPAIGMILASGDSASTLMSPQLPEGLVRYVRREKQSAALLRMELEQCEGLLIWGTGDNFYRNCGNDGPLSRMRNPVLLDSNPRVVKIQGRSYQTMQPHDGIQTYPWPVIVTVCEDRHSIAQEVEQISPGRHVLYV